MLYLNKERVNQDFMKKSENQWIAEAFSDIQSNIKPVIFKGNDGIRFSSNGVRERPRTKTIPTIDYRPNKSGLEDEWIWSDGQILDFGKKPKDLHFKEHLQLDPKKDTELIFYLMHVSRFKTLTHSEIEKGRRLNPNAFFSEIDEGAEASRRLAEKKLRAEVEAYIITDMSPLFDDMETFVQLASAWGVADVDDKPIDKIREELSDQVHWFEENKEIMLRGYREFLDDCKQIVGGDVSRKIKVTALVQNCIDKHIIIWDSGNNHWTWYGTDTVICRVPFDASRRADKYLVDHLLKDRDGKDIAKTMQLRFSQKNLLTPEKVQATNHMATLRRWASGINIKWKQNDKAETIKEKLLETLIKNE